MKAFGVKGVEAHQGHLESAVRRLFDGKDIKSNVRKEVHLKNPFTGKYLELDIWIPELQICFEFQDAYHYTSTWESPHPQDVIHARDNLKKNIILKRKYSLVFVPCWWDVSDESLVATIKFHRPDLLPHQSTRAHPIPDNPPPLLFDGDKKSDIGELMLTSFPSYDFDKRLSSQNSWWLGEKYDGVRVCWHPSLKELYTRSGIDIEIPQKFVNMFPKSFLDGEMWFGRGLFPDSQMVVLSPETVYWGSCRIVAFDDPSPDSRHLPFEDRYRTFLFSLSPCHPLVINAPRIYCISSRLLKWATEELLKQGGEGVILRRPSSLYIPGRSNYLLKLKAARDDQEALVVGVSAKEPKYTLQLATGMQFELSSENFKFGVVAKKGDVVSFTYESYSRRAVPLSPRIYRIRYDLPWEQVLRELSPRSFGLGLASRDFVEYKKHPLGYWTSEKGRNMRKFFEEFAKKNKKDPLDPTFWYTVSKLAIKKSKGGYAVLQNFKGRFIDALVQLFPDLKLDPQKFWRNGYWLHAPNRRQLFERLARHYNIDPLSPSGWYSLTRKNLMAYKGVSHLLDLYYNRSIIQALTNIFPNIGLDKQKLAAALFRIYPHSCPCCHAVRKSHKCKRAFCNSVENCGKPHLHQNFLFAQRVAWCERKGWDVSPLHSNEGSSSQTTQLKKKL